jgi:choline dehydrogenase-like flavoprotein
MIFESFQAFQAASFAPKVAVIGSGPAGITIARKLARSNLPVVIFEAGSERFSDESQAFYGGRTVGDPYFALDETRLRFLGGSSNHWAGWCRLLDEEDFRAKPWAADTDWPIRRRDLEPYAEEVREVLGLEPFRPDVPISGDIRWVQLIKSNAVRFGLRYGGEIGASEMISLVLNSYVTSLEGDGQAVNAINLWSPDGQTGRFHADYVILCTGGLENSRLLLWSNERSNGRVVPHAAALGRYWMEHPHFECGNAILNDTTRFEADADGEAFFSPSWDAMQRRGILNFGIRMVEMPYDGVKQLVANLACTAPSAAEWMSDGLGQRLKCAAQLHMAWEQAPLASNRVQLNRTMRDASGVPRIDLHWRKGPLEHRTLIEGMRLFGRALIEANIGRVRLADWLANGEAYPFEDMELAGNHHMGGTRMSDDPARGVVDADCKVHGMRNLFVGGSSVFPTSGQTNPTTTITALACRLADHLVQRVHADDAVASVGAPVAEAAQASELVP